MPLELDKELIHLFRKMRFEKPKEFAALLATLSKEEVMAIFYEWAIWRHDTQIMPQGRWRWTMALGGRGAGKLFSPDTDVMTLNKGWIKLKDIEIGDKVFDENGKECNVVNVYEPDIKEISQTYLLHFSDNTSLYTCGDHQWVTWTHRDRKQFSRKKKNGAFPPPNWPVFKGGVYHARSKEPVGYYGPEIRTTQQILETLTQGKRRDLNHCIPTAGVLEIPFKATTIDPYIYGYWLGDGSKNTSQITIHKDDQENFELECEKAGYSLNIHKSPKSVLIPKLISKLKEQDTPDKDKVHEDYLYNTKEVRLSFLQGLMDSDGYVSNKDVEFCSMKKLHADAVYFLAASLGQKPIIKTGRALFNGKDYGIKYRVFFTPTINVFRLPRKAQKVDLIFKKLQRSRHLHRMITGATPVEPVEGMRCITVDSPNNMWLVGKNFIPTHNTKLGAEWIRERAYQGKGPITLIGQTAKDVRDVMVEVGPSSILNVCPPWFMPRYEPSKSRLTFPNGVIATTYSGDEPGQLRGPQSRTIWIDELPKFKEPEETFDQANFGLRIGEDAAGLITTTPTPHKLIKYLYRQWEANPEGLIRIMSLPTISNKANLTKDAFIAFDEKYKGTRLERQELFGEILWDSENALFSPEDIEKYRVESHPELKRIIVALDPSVTDNKNSDSTGMIVAGLGIDNHGYVLKDSTMKSKPEAWARKAAELFKFYNADLIVAEKNQGGDMVMSTIQSYKANLPVKLVTATKGKLIRAEPISLLFEQGKIHMVGNFPELEQEMVEYDGTQKKSPDRYDAFIWAMTELMLGMQSKTTISELVF